MVDLVTTGPIVGTHSMVDLGACCGSIKHGVFSRFNAVLRPIGPDPGTNPEAHVRAQKDGRSAGDVIREFAAWCVPFQSHQVIFVCRPAAFDWPWIVWYARTYLGKNPFGYRVVCALSWDLAKGKKFEIELTKTAARDAELQLKEFLKGV
jgi:hypothetical protein